MGFLQSGGRRAGQAENLPDQLFPQLRLQALNERFNLGNAAGRLIHFDVVYGSHSSHLSWSNCFKRAIRLSTNSSAAAGFPLIHQTGSGSVR